MVQFLLRAVVVSCFLSAPITLFAESVLPLQFSVTDSQGDVTVWSVSERSKYRLDQLERIHEGHTITTQQNSTLQLTFSPTITLDIKENSVVALQNLRRDSERDVVRMLVLVQKGGISLNTGVAGANTLLLTIRTPCANIDIQQGRVDLNIFSDHSVLDVIDGFAKVRNSSSAIKTKVFSGSRIRVFQNRSEVAISDISADKPRRTESSQPTIAILSIRSTIAEEENLSRISDLVGHQYEKEMNTKVFYLEDIRNLLRAEELTGLLGCFTDSCVSKIGSAIGADYAIVGDLGKMGSSYILGLRLIDALRYQVVGRVSGTVSDDPGKIVGIIPELVESLAKKSSQELPKREDKVSYSDGSQPRHFKQQLVWIEPGEFVMGSNHQIGSYDEVPEHTVSLDGFYMQAYEVTKIQFEEVMGFNPSAFKGCRDCPVDNVTWFEADEYCRKIGMRLPTEAQWEYAARAGTNTIFHYGNTLSSSQANFNGREPYGGVPVHTSMARPVPVGEYNPNGWNLYDMHGNVAEWCADWYDAAYYGNSPGVNPKGPADGKLRVVRGGSWRDGGTSLRVARRVGYNPSIRLNTVGFRCVKDFEE